MKKILHKPSGFVYEYTPILAQRDDIEIIEEVDGVQIVDAAVEKPKRKRKTEDGTEVETDQDF